MKPLTEAGLTAACAAFACHPVGIHLFVLFDTTYSAAIFRRWRAASMLVALAGNVVYTTFRHTHMRTAVNVLGDYCRTD